MLVQTSSDSGPPLRERSESGSCSWDDGVLERNVDVAAEVGDFAVVSPSVALDTEDGGATRWEGAGGLRLASPLLRGRFSKWVC